MLKLTVIFAVITIFLSVQHVQSRALKSLNIQGILQNLQKQLQLEQVAEKKRQQFSVEALDDDYNGYSPNNLKYYVRSLNKKKHRHQDRDDDDRRDQSSQLLHKLGGVYDKQSRELKSLLNKPKSAKSLNALLGDRSDEDRDNRHHKLQSVKKLTSLVDKSQDEDAYYRHHESRPGSALASLLDDRQDDDRDDHHLQDLSSYKSVYLVLDPEAVEKSHIKDKLGNLLSKLLIAFRQSNQRDRRERKKDRHYEGFAERRKGRDSKISEERYAANDSPERDYSPKRSRPERSGGGGGGGSRTAIPYIGHRGDIYERDN